MPLFDGLEKATRKFNSFRNNIFIYMAKIHSRECFKAIIIKLAHNAYICINIWYLCWHLFLGVPYKCCT